MKARMMAARGESGFTVIELMVTLMLMGLVSVVLFGFLDGTTSATTRASADIQAEKDAQIVLRTLSQDIRGAQQISTTYPAGNVCPTGGSFATPFNGYKTCLSFRLVRSTTGGVAGCPYTAIVYGLRANVLRQNRTEYDCSNTATAATIEKVVMTDVVNTASQPLFTYYDRRGADMLAGSPVRPTNAATVKITLVKDYGIRNTPDLTLSSVISLRNNR